MSADPKNAAAITEHADCLAALVRSQDDTFAECSSEFKRAYLELLTAVARLGERYTFDRDGRPGAIAAVREALPVIERDLFEAIIDDHACEVAAIEEALYRMAIAYGRRRQEQG